MELRSDAFDYNRSIPAKYTCEGQNVSPPLRWSGAPKGARSFALIVEDPDAPDPNAPQRVFTHWVVFNLPPQTTSLREGAANDLPRAARAGKNDWDRTSYGGPCPPIGRHRYFHKVYALDTELDLRAPTKAQLLEAMQGHILDTAELMGTYEKTGS